MSNYVDIYRIYECPREPMTILIWRGLTSCIIKCTNPDKLPEEDWKYCIESGGVRYEVSDKELNDSKQDYSKEISDEYSWAN
jgi:hypothetical protein